MPDGAVVSLDIGVLLRLSGLNAAQGNAPLRGPYRQCCADVFWTVVDPDGHGRAAPFDDLAQRAHDASGTVSMSGLSRRPGLIRRFSSSS